MVQGIVENILHSKFLIKFASLRLHLGLVQLMLKIGGWVLLEPLLVVQGALDSTPLPGDLVVFGEHVDIV